MHLWSSMSQRPTHNLKMASSSSAFRLLDRRADPEKRTAEWALIAAGVVCAPSGGDVQIWEKAATLPVTRAKADRWMDAMTRPPLSMSKGTGLGTRAAVQRTSGPMAAMIWAAPIQAAACRVAVGMDAVPTTHACHLDRSRGWWPHRC